MMERQKKIIKLLMSEVEELTVKMNHKFLNKDNEEFVSSASKDLEGIDDEALVAEYLMRTLRIYATLTGLSTILNKVQGIVGELEMPDTDEKMEVGADEVLDLFGSIAEDISMPQSDIVIDDEGEDDELRDGKKGTK